MPNATYIASSIEEDTGNYYSITFNANGGTGTMTTQRIGLEGGIALNPNLYVREGYTFNGWNTKADGTGTAYSDQEVMTFNSGANRKIILYAQWTD